MYKVGMISLGCPKNQVDAERMLAKLDAAEFEVCDCYDGVDAVIVNTCGFIDAAKEEAIENILDMAQLKSEGTVGKIIVTGCLAQRYKDEIFSEMPEVDAVIGIGANDDIAEIVKSVIEGKREYRMPENCCLPLTGERLLTTPEYWSYLKIADGCSNRCTYCAIPSIRGKFRSRPIEELVAEARDLEALGAREISIIAQDITRYGVDLYGEYSLARLLRELTAATKTVYFRLLYCYPDKVTDELVAEIRDNPRVLKYVDIPLQHISDSVLRRMNRHGDSAMIRDVIKRLRDNVPGIVLRTTFITGFPGETEEDFEELCRFVNETKFERLGVFPYSQEEGTPAASFPDQIDDQVKQDRADIIMRDQLEISEARNRSLIGTTQRVLCEDFDPVSDMHYGRSYADAPEIDGKIYFRAPGRIAPGSFVNVKITDVLDYDLCGVAETK